jgi:cold shock CspA family protein
MRFSGQLKSWNAERAFGFIEPTDGGQEIFLHVSAVPTQLRPPKIGQRFTFEVELNREGKKRASNVGVERAPLKRRQPRRDSPAPWSRVSALAIPVFIAIYIALALTRGVSIWFAGAYGALSIVCLMAYASASGLPWPVGGAGRRSHCCFLGSSVVGREVSWLSSCFVTNQARLRSAVLSG